MMIKPWSIAIVALLAFEYPQHAQASRCPRGDIYRVSLKLCVGRDSRLALAFERRPRAVHHHGRERLLDRTHYAEIPSHADVVYVTVVEPEIEPPFELPSSRWNHAMAINWILK